MSVGSGQAEVEVGGAAEDDAGFAGWGVRGVEGEGGAAGGEGGE